MRGRRIKTMNVLILKLTDRLLKQKNLTVADLAPDKLKKRASGDWKIGPKRLDDVEMVVVLYHGTIIAQFELSARVTYDRETHRSTLELIDYTGSNHLVGSTVDYETKNPATIKTINQFTSLITEIKRGSNKNNREDWQLTLLDVQRRLAKETAVSTNSKAPLLWNSVAPFSLDRGTELDISYTPYSPYFGVNPAGKIKNYVIEHTPEIFNENRKNCYVGYDINVGDYYLSDVPFDSPDFQKQSQHFETVDELYQELKEQIKSDQTRLNQFIEKEANK